MSPFTLIIGGAALVASQLLIMIALRRVVPTNMVHIVQSRNATLSYGKGTKNGNVYYEWPSFLPLLGVRVIALPVSNFDIDLDAYEAYDEGRLPFMVDVKAFFRVSNPEIAAQRVSSFDELCIQLKAVVQGAVRSILASNHIEEIMQGRSKFSDLFTKEVQPQLEQWGVEPVKNIELMDIRDSGGSKVIANIMAKKKSQIESESRQAIAENERNAALKEVAMRQETELRSQEARQKVGERQIAVDQHLSQEGERSKQAVAELAKETAQREVEVQRVRQTREAEMKREVALVGAEQERQTRTIKAETDKAQRLIDAEAEATAQVREAEGHFQAEQQRARGLSAVGVGQAEAIAAEGRAKAEAEAALLMAPVTAQIALATQIGGNAGYQDYLIRVEQIHATQHVGEAQAKALEKAEIKVIVTAGTAGEGVSSVGQLISAQGGARLGAMIEGLSQTPMGAAVAGKLLGEEKPARDVNAETLRHARDKANGASPSF